MTIDTYNLSEEQYTKFFHDNVRLAAKLYLDAVNITVAEGIGNVDFKTLREIYNDAIYATNDDCRRYQKEHNPEVIKDNDLFDLGPTRVEMMEEIKDADRIFKLSGRYQVTDKFDITKFSNENTKDKFVFKRAQPSWINPQDTGVTTLLQTRLWSFTPNLLVETMEIYKNIIENMIRLFNENKYIDNEHSMSKYIPKDRLVELETVGLVGNIAPNGMMIID